MKEWERGGKIRRGKWKNDSESVLNSSENLVSAWHDAKVCSNCADKDLSL